MARKEIIGVRIKLATSERIREISSGEVKKPETINYRTLRPEKEAYFAREFSDLLAVMSVPAENISAADLNFAEIGRASCRERV